MKTISPPKKLSVRSILIAACTVALTITIIIMLPQPARADKITLPAVPSNIQVPEGNKVFLVGHATGTQNYICMVSGSGYAYTLFTPQATLFDDNNEQIITHFFSPNPSDGTFIPTWQHSQDTSKVWARMVQNGASSDPDFVAPGAIAWLLLGVVNHQDGPKGGDKLSETTFIQRLNTSGGLAPSTGCASLTDIGNRAYVPYTADYYFYK